MRGYHHMKKKMILSEGCRCILSIGVGVGGTKQQLLPKVFLFPFYLC